MISREERLKVLEMLQEGKITAEEAARLLEALEAAPGPKAPPPP
ncbi:SHOCT-like domain-containing protein, partial [Thermanaerothrix sp.]